MLIKNTRISKKKDFDNIFKKGKSARGVSLVIRFLENDLKINRFAFIVSKKVSPRAVVRNKIRRRLSESIKEFRTESKKGVDIIFIASPTIKKKNFFEIKEETNSLLKKIVSKDKI